MKNVETWRKFAQSFDVNGARIAFWTSADPSEQKPWLLLIHGYPTSSWDWTGIWDGLSANFNLAALDMLGFGLSDKPTSTYYSIVSQADLQEALLSHLGVSEAHIFAHDYGNSVGQELLARHNEGALSFAIKSMCFLNGGLFPEQHRALTIQKLGLSPLGPLLGAMLSRDKLRDTFNGIFGPNTKPSAAEIDAHWAFLTEQNGRKVFHKLLQYIPQRKANRERWVGALKNTHLPLCLINGGTDPISGKHLYDYFCEQVPKATAYLLNDIGHYPHTESPERTLKAFFRFHSISES
ncbi:alpha/beta fold hydrolase [Hyphococcus sp. DH-69]